MQKRREEKRNEEDAKLSQKKTAHFMHVTRPGRRRQIEAGSCTEEKERPQLDRQRSFFLRLFLDQQRQHQYFLSEPKNLMGTFGERRRRRKGGMSRLAFSSFFLHLPSPSAVVCLLGNGQGDDFGGMPCCSSSGVNEWIPRNGYYCRRRRVAAMWPDYGRYEMEKAALQIWLRRRLSAFYFI